MFLENEKKILAADPVRLLKWYAEAGLDIAVCNEPQDAFDISERKKAEQQPMPTFVRPTATAAPKERPLPTSLQEAASRQALPANSRMAESEEEAVKSAVSLAQNAASLDELRAAVETFNGCALKTMASSTVFGAGTAEAEVMLIGEAPGAEEDRQGLPFVGESGHLLDKMLASIDMAREDTYITNILPWRPPGNRTPTHAEMAACLPFIERHIELVAPKVLLLLGGSAASTLLGRAEGISKLRGRWFDYETPGLSHPVKALPLFHPAYLLRTPAQKRLAWRDLLTLKGFLTQKDETTV